MSKYNSLKILKIRRATVNHQCHCCGEIIFVNDFYYSEESKNKFIHFINKRDFCNKCYQNHKDDLLDLE